MPTYYDYRALLVSNTEGWHDGSDEISYYFLQGSMPSYYSYDYFNNAWYVGSGEYVGLGNDFSMTASEEALMRLALAAWDEVANLNLVEGSGTRADINIGSTEFGDEYLFGFVSDFPDPDDLGTTPSTAGDVWINRDNPDQYLPGIGPVHGHTSWNTMLHELGHALGLRHPNENPNNSDTSGQYTVMSYIAHPEEADDSWSEQAWALTPLLWDIAALQALYGVNTETRAGDTVYFGNGNASTAGAELEYQYGADGMQVRGADGEARDVILAIWDAGGTDLIDASDLRTASRIDLRPGQFSSIGEIDNNIAVATAVQVGGEVINYVENAWGGSGNDWIGGNGADNALRGGGGRDRLLGRGGDDDLRGGSGNDAIKGGSGDDALRGEGGDDRLVGQSGADWLKGGGGSDRMLGGSGNDRLLGGGGRDVLKGGGGNDRLVGQGGNDRLDGGGGDDWLVGKRGADTFVFSAGQDVIADFQLGVRGEVVDLRRVDSITGYNDLTSNHLREDTDGVWIEDGAGNATLLRGIELADLNAGDFLF